MMLCLGFPWQYQGKQGWADFPKELKIKTGKIPQLPNHVISVYEQEFMQTWNVS